MGTAIDVLIDYIDKAIQKNSVSNRHVAEVLAWLNEELKKKSDLKLSDLEELFLSSTSNDSAQGLITFLAGLSSEELSTFKKGLLVIGHTITDSLSVNSTATILNAVIQSLLNTENLNVRNTATLVKGLLKDSLQSETFTSNAFIGTGFKLFKDALGDWGLELDNLTIRKLFKIYELIMVKYRSVNGGLIVSEASGKVSEVILAGGYYSLAFEDGCQFLEGDLIRCKTNKGNIGKDYFVEVLRISGTHAVIAATEFGSVVPEIGDECVLFGSTSNPNRRGLILISAESGKPRISLFQGINSRDIASKLVTALGDLTGLSDSDFGNLSGHGLYSNNAYLKGVFYLKNSGQSIETVITNINHQISLKASQVDLTALGSRMSEAELNLQSDRIWLGISSFMKSSTRNLVLNSGLFKSAEGWIAIGLGSYSNMFLGDNGALHLNILSTNELYNWGHIAPAPTLKIALGKTYCYKVKIKTNSSQFRLGFRDPAGNFFYEKTFNTKNSGYNEYYYFVNHDNAAALNLTPLIQVNPNSVSMGTTFSVEYMMLAEATIETDWCPAPEDIEAIIRAGVEVVQDEVRLYGRVIVNGTMIANMIEATGLKIKDANGSVTNEIKTDGSMHIASGKTQLNANGSGQFAGGNLYWDEIGRLFKKQREYIVWRNMLTEMGANTILNIFPEQGTFIDIGVPFGQANRRINLPDPTLYPDLEFDIRYDRTEGDTVLRIGCTSHPIKYYSASKNQLFPFALDYFYPNKDGIIKGTILSKGNYWFVSSELYNE